ncbi:MAG: 23S rRNA (pseudouridine(1915)-N(3))-methyltransferase RlmH [Saprospiraceae bacterium]|nr:23S rRNA (pseudouridine(1915)-N(3))-methyltransferase RlmH [Saprospiraceae bacterium]
MKFELWVIGKTTPQWIEEGINEFTKRLKLLQPVDFVLFNDVKNAKSLPVNILKQKEGEMILQKMANEDYLILCDDKGKQFSSKQFSVWLEKLTNLSKKRIIVLIGGAYGFSDEIYSRANEQISFSKMTFSHQLIRIIVIEQIYRGFSILKNLPYHHG